MKLTHSSHRYRPWALIVAMAIGVAIASAQTPSYDYLVGQARKQIDGAQFAAAVASGKQAIMLDRARWEAYLVVGVSENEQKHFDLAITAFSQSLAFAPDDKKSGVQQLLEKAILAKNGGGAAPPMAMPAMPAPIPQPAAPSAEQIALANKKAEASRAWARAAAQIATLSPGSKYTEQSTATLSGCQLKTTVHVIDSTYDGGDLTYVKIFQLGSLSPEVGVSTDSYAKENYKHPTPIFHVNVTAVADTIHGTVAGWHQEMRSGLAHDMNPFAVKDRKEVKVNSSESYQTTSILAFASEDSARVFADGIQALIESCR